MDSWLASEHFFQQVGHPRSRILPNLGLLFSKDMEQAGEDLHQPVCQRANNLYVIGRSGEEVEHVTIRHCYLHDCTTTMLLSAHFNHAVFEHCHFARSILDGTEPLTTGRRALRDVELAEELARMAVEGTSP